MINNTNNPDIRSAAGGTLMFFKHVRRKMEPVIKYIVYLIEYNTKQYNKTLVIHLNISRFLIFWYLFEVLVMLCKTYTCSNCKKCALIIYLEITPLVTQLVTFYL